MTAEGAEVVPGLVRDHGLRQLREVCALGLKRAEHPIQTEAFKERLTQTRLPMGTDELSLRPTQNALKWVCLLKNLHFRIYFHPFLLIYIVGQHCMPDQSRVNRK